MIQYVLISVIATVALQYLYIVLYSGLGLSLYVENLRESIGSGATMLLANLPMLGISLAITYSVVAKTN